MALARHQPAKPTTAQPRAVTTPRPQPQAAPTVPQRQQQTPGGNPLMVHGAGTAQAKSGPAAPRLNHPAVIQRMEDKKANRKQRKAQNAMMYSVDQQKQLERKVVKSGVTTNRVAETISEGVSNLSNEDTNKIGHGLGNKTSKTRGGNEQAVGGFYGSLNSNLTNTNESNIPQPRRNANFTKNVDIGQVVEKRNKKKTERRQQQQQSGAHEATHRQNTNDISTKVETRKPFSRNISGVLRHYKKCDKCNDYWVLV